MIDSDTILIGHSSGSVEILRLLEVLPQESVVKAALLVSAFKDDLGWETLTGLFEAPFDFESIKSHCKEIIFIHSDNDPYVPLEQAKYLNRKVGNKLLVLKGQGHFNTESSLDYVQFPRLLEVVESVDTP